VTSHPTADEVYEMVRKRLPRISLGTVYRNLEILSDAGVIMKLDLAGARKRFDGNPKNHYHIRCRRCGRVDDVTMGPIPEIERLSEQLGDYMVESHTLEFTGYCPDCKDHRAEAEG
jgi:Fur family ferric uptake transcriptional regulator